MTALSETFAPNDFFAVGTSSMSNYSIWGPIFRPVSSIVLIQTGELSDDARDILSKIKSFSHLQENWDSYGAEPPSKIAVENALSFVKTVDKRRVPLFFAAPGANGEILVELRENGKSVEVLFEANGTASYTKLEYQTPVESGTLTDPILPNLAAWISS